MSAIAALNCFLVDQGNFSTNDFTLSNWKSINKIGADWETLVDQPVFSASPSLENWEGVLPSLDVWLDVGSDEIHYVSDLLPSIDWNGGLLGVRLRLEPRSVEDLFKEYVLAIRAAKETVKGSQSKTEPQLPTVELWPGTMRDFLDRKLGSLFTVRGYPLDPSKRKNPEKGTAVPQQLPPGSEPIGRDPLEGLIRIDVIYAQREFADAYPSKPGTRTS